MDWEAIRNQAIGFGETDSMSGYGWCYIASRQDLGQQVKYDVDVRFAREVLLRCYEAALINPTSYQTSSHEELERLGRYLREPVK